MRIVLQRVQRACVRIDESVVGQINTGFLLLVGVHQSDHRATAQALANKCADLRIFEDDQGKMNRSIIEVHGEALVVSQFTLYGDCRKGRRPSFSDAAPPDHARQIYAEFVAFLREKVARVETGVFGAHMQVELVNDGPVTLLLDDLAIPRSSHHENSQ